MPDPLASISTRRTPQAEQADARQVPNSAGGFTFTTGKTARLHRFLTLGTDGGTYYTSERDLTKANAGIVLEWARADAVALAIQVARISQAGRAPRNNPALFALAAAASLGSDAGRRTALNLLPEVARTGTHLFTFAGYVEQFRGWGRGLRHGVGNWYLGTDIDGPADQDISPADADRIAVNRLAYQLVKYRQRGGWTHRDLLRLAHPIADSPYRNELFRWATGKDVDQENLPGIVQAYEQAQAIGARGPMHTHGDPNPIADWVALIAANPSLSWEMLPSAALNAPDVWRALIQAGMPQTALMRQLPRLTRLGVLGPADLSTTGIVAAQLADPERLINARVHPVNVLVALRTYASGQSARGDSSWTPVSRITDALDAAFYASYRAVTPSGKRIVNALDVSGSMTQAVSGLPLSCREATAALALVSAATEPATITVGFTASAYRSSWHDAAISLLDISPRQRLDDAIRKVSGLPFGGTDCALPMIWALQNGVQADVFQIYTDNETWAGGIHPHQALEQYRQQTGIPARMAVIGMTATDFTIADPDDPGTLDVAGFDSAVPQLLADFGRGDL